MGSDLFLLEQLIFCAFTLLYTEYNLVFQLSICGLGVTSPLLRTQVFSKKKVTAHVFSNSQYGVVGLDFGSVHLGYQQRGGNARPAYILY
jgi:hypothetical protein